MNIDTLTNADFNKLPLVAEGESKEVRYYGNGKVVIRLKPTIYSYTHNRSGVIKGSDTLRLEAIKSLLPILKQAGIKHSYIQVTDKWILSDLVLQPKTESCPTPFRPIDLADGELKQLLKAPPIEVVVKAVHSGTPKHRYYKIDEFPLRNKFSRFKITNEGKYPQRIVRFDWRNPMENSHGQRLADEVLPEVMANWYINTSNASKTASKVFSVLEQFFESKGLSLWDICFFIDESGDTLFGEVSPDCLRVRSLNDEPLDKDIWRHGGSSADVLKKWQAFVNMINTD